MAFWRSKSEPKAADATQPTAGAASGKGGPAEGGSLLARMRAGLEKTRTVLNTDVRDLFKSEGRLVDDTLLEELFARLIRTDMGVEPATEICDRIGRDYRARVVQFDELLQTIADQTREMLSGASTQLARAESGPTIILVVGVNGSGKTTSIGKLANNLHRSGQRVLLGAGDTFRAAAVEQLTVWSQRIGCDIVTGPPNSDPASVAFRTAQRAVEEQYDVAVIDTAGRLQNQTHLMQQLDKIRRVVSKQIPEAPHEVLLVLDATAGQNAISQARGFSEVAGCTGIILAKLDGSAKGGVILPIRRQFDLPVKFVGLGEGIDDLSPFDPASFAAALFSR